MSQVGRVNCIWGMSCAVVLGLLASGCSSGSSSDDGSAGGGEVTDEWRDYCIATFIRDVPIEDLFGDVAFTAHTNSEYLLTEYYDFGDTPQAEIAFLTASGPDTYAIPATGSPATFPFTTNCAIDTAVQYYAAFTDVTVYDSEALTNEICKIKAGTAFPRDTSTNAGAAATSLNLNGPQTYRIMLNAFGPMCGGATDGYVSVPPVQLFGSTTWLIPITTVMKPPQ